MSAAPGRVNLIGEHTDYNGGFVLPMALQLYTVLVGRPTPGSNIVRLYSDSDNVNDSDRLVEFSLDDPIEPTGPDWAKYVKGVIHHTQLETGCNLKTGFEGVFTTSVPLGGGLSSSAALEVATISFLTELLGCSLISMPLDKKAIICQKAEHTFANMPCGIMDQFISIMGRAGHALLLDCRSLDTKLVPLDDPSVTVLITNSNVRHSLTGSEYPTRRNTCAKVAALFGKETLRDLSAAELTAGINNGTLTEEMIRFARHVITEISRTEKAAHALETRNYEQLGELMIESHASLRDDYRVSCDELDQLVDLALSVTGVYGSRMTGGGFGGCTVTLLKTDSLQEVMDKISANYSHSRPSFYACSPADGAQFRLL